MSTRNTCINVYPKLSHAIPHSVCVRVCGIVLYTGRCVRTPPNTITVFRRFFDLLLVHALYSTKFLLTKTTTITHSRQIQIAPTNMGCLNMYVCMSDARRKTASSVRVWYVLFFFFVNGFMLFAMFSHGFTVLLISSINKCDLPHHQSVVRSHRTNNGHSSSY